MNNSVSTSLHQRKSTKKKTKPKSKAVKVVYISNPMKVKTCPSRFRALVQELTGQDAEFPADPTKWYFTSADGNINGGDLIIGAADPNPTDSDERRIVGPGNNNNITDDNDDDEHEAVVLSEVPTVGPAVVAAAPHVPSQPLDDEIFTAQMMENFSGLFQSSLYYNEPAASQVDLLTMLNDVMWRKTE